MKKVFNKSIKFLLLILMIYSFIIPVSSKTKEEAKKGDIYNPQINSVGDSATINAYNYANNKTYEAGDVEVKKVVTKQNDDGLYNVEFYVRGKEGVVTETKDTYIVFVIDRSYTMRLNNRWEDAKNAVINISKELSKVDGIKMALVGFSGGKARSQNAYDDTVTLRGTFSSKAFTSNEVGNYDDDNWLGGGTNIHAGLLKANDLLKNKIGTKHVVLLSDGVPTLYYDSNGYSLGPGNSNSGEKISQVPICKDKAISAAKTLKNNDVSIYTIGYQLNELTNNFTYKGVNYNEKSLAIETLKGIATSNSYYYQSDSNTNNTIAKVLKEIQTEITTFPAGYNPIINDVIGPNFKLSNNQNYGGTKTLSKNITITEKWQKIGSFNINIDKTIKDGWYKTNNNFTLIYEVASGSNKTVTCTDNPEVYWKQDKFPYIVNYYKDAISDNNFLGNYSNEEENKTIIKDEDIDLLKHIPKGYYLDGMYDINGINKIDSITIDKDKENVINILYKIKKFNYTVSYYYADENNNYSDIPDNTKKVKDVDYGTIINLSDHYLTDKDIKEGFNLDSNKTTLENDSSYIVDRDGIIINIYYNRNNYKYKVNYYFNNVIDESLTKIASSLYGSVIYAKDYYLNEELINKNNSDNTTYFLDPNNINNTSNITVSSKEEENVLNIYYIDTSFTNETIDKFTNIDVVNNSKTIIPYAIEYNVDINNIRKEDKVITIITDTLPYEIDETKSNLNGGIYDKDNKTITWTFEEKITDYKVIHNIYKKIEYSVQYKNFADISYSVDNFLINNVNGYTKVNNKQSSGVSDKEDIEVLIKGYVTAIYVDEKDKILADNTYLSGLVGDKYETNPKDILGYTLVEEKYPQNSKGKYKEEDIIVKYVYKKNNGEVMHKVTKEGTNKVDSINDKFDYKIIVNSNILDYVGSVKLKVIDILPYKIDKSKSKIDDRCKYDGNKKITCQIDYGQITQNDYKLIDNKSIFNINEIFNLELYYIDIDSNTIENKVSSEIILDSISDKKEDSFITNIPIGKVIVNYITKDNKKLDDTIIISDLVGTSYETIKKEFNKYSFIEVKGDVKGEIKEQDKEVTYIYDLTPLPPHTGVNKHGNKVFYFWLLSFLIIPILKIKRSLL